VPDAETHAAQLQAVIRNLSSGTCTQGYTQTAQDWLREYQHSRNAWQVSLAFLRHPERCQGQTELFFHAQTLHVKAGLVGVGADNTFDEAGVQQLKRALYEVRFFGCRACCSGSLMCAASAR
jgi:hypothetical protein